MKTREKGLTLVEIILTVAMLAILVAAFVALIRPVTQFFQQTKEQGQLTQNARIAMDTMTHLIREGMATSVVRCSCSGPTACSSTCSPMSSAPFSHIDFALQGNTTNYSIYWRTDNNTLEVDKSWPGGLNKSTLASNVTGLAFNGNSQDPGVISISLQLASPGNMSSLIISSETVHMIATP